MYKFYYIVKDNNGRDRYKEERCRKIEATDKRRAVSRAEYEAFDETKTARIYELMERLAQTDYIACKIAEGAAVPEEYADVIAERAAWRAEINKLRGEGDT